MRNWIGLVEWRGGRTGWRHLGLVDSGRLLLSGSGGGTGGHLNDEAFDKVLGEDALLPLAAGPVDVLAAVPVVILDGGHGDDGVGGEVEVVLVWRGVVEEGLDLEGRWVRRGHEGLGGRVWASALECEYG